MLPLLFLFFAGAPSAAAETDPGRSSDADPGFRFPGLHPDHTHMRLLIENAMRYADPRHGIVDPASGYPVEGWNQEPEAGLHLRSFTQLTAIGLWIELMANIAAGYAENPYVSRSAALDNLSHALKSLREDQRNPSISDRGLLVNFLGLEGGKRKGPLLDSVDRERFTSSFGEEQGMAVWRALEKKGWILPEDKGRRGTVQRNEKYGSAHFDGALAPYANEPLRSSIMSILDKRVVLVIFGDNVNLTASIAKSIGALLRPELGEDPRARALREEMEQFLDGQRDGYAHLFDPETGTFLFGWNATTGRFVGWDDGRGNWVRGQMNYLINEFRGGWLFTVLRHGLQENSIRNAGFKIKPYRDARGEWTHALAAWDGSAFQLLGLSLFMQEQRNPGWKRALQDIVAVELDYSRRRALPGFLSEAYSGNGTEYTGYIGIPDLAVTDKPLIDHAPSLYTLGVAYMVAPQKIEEFLRDQWPSVSELLTEHGPWEGRNTGTGRAIRYQTTVHTLSLILGGITSADENMRRYLELKGLSVSLERLYRPGDRSDWLSEAHRITPWSTDERSFQFRRENGGCRFAADRIRMGGIAFTAPEEQGVSLSNGTLRIRYLAEAAPENARIGFKWAHAAPSPTPSIPIEIFLPLRKTEGTEEEMEIVLPATPALEGIGEVSLVWGAGGITAPVDITIMALEFVPFSLALAP